MMHASIGTTCGFLLAMSSGARGQSDWSLVAPRSNTLPKGEPPASFDRRENIISPLGVSSSLDARPALLHTNKFYANLLLDSSSRAAWALPYILTINEEYPFGLYVSYPRFFEGERQDDRLKWYATTTGKDIILSAQELRTNQEAELTDFDDEGFSATVKFSSQDTAGGSMTTYIVRGMAYATVLYEDFTPEMATQHAILRVNGNAAAGGVHTNSRGRFMLELNDGSTWIVYSSNRELELSYVPATSDTPSSLRAKSPMTGTLRATRVPYESDSAEYDEAMGALDEHAGCYPIKGELQAWMDTKSTNRGRYKISWTTGGDDSGLLHFALPHHQGMLETSKVARTGLYVSSPTKGNMELVIGKIWEVNENDLPDFEWVPSKSRITSNVEREWIEYYLEEEISVPLDNVAGSSVYFGGKNLMAYAQLCLVADEIGRDDLVGPCVDQVEAGFDMYLMHSNGNPLVYDKIWGGVIGGLGLEEDSRAADFYASYYNDHHFHYSYVINAAAVLAHLRPSWATSDNVAWVNTLIRDVNDPNKYDAFFPQFRSFDWFSGHSWARGLLFAFDGKDQESTSEDVNFFYAMTMWAIATGNTALEGLGRLQTGVVKRSINEYFLLKDSNTNHPADFVKNKVTGIFFESKVDYTTWFGANVEYIHGIQNIPVTPITEYVRDPQFVSEEWNQRLQSVVGGAEGSWNTVLYMSYATIEKHLAFKEMITSGVDDGLQRAWALYWAATRPDCATFCAHSDANLDRAPEPTPTLLPAVPTPTPTPVMPVPTATAGAFTCDGVERNNFCCSSGCRQCGGSNCSKQEQIGLTGEDCCQNRITASGRLCSVTQEAPCYMDAPSSSAWVAPASSAYGGIPAVIPGMVQAEKFDHGGEGVSYSDTTPGNSGGVFRPNEDVDISGGHDDYHVAWIRATEFLRYTVNVEKAASAFDFTFQVATIPSYHDSGSFRVVTGGTGCDDYTTDLSGLVVVPSTGGWGTFASLPVRTDWKKVLTSQRWGANMLTTSGGQDPANSCATQSPSSKLAARGATTSQPTLAGS
ncbi:Endo-1,3-beta-glucanase, family GH81 [Ectocarpus siliculosus]|uniref:glucan endo-1,3-beta-D-glucosidase n=1 Tax=Ectocarpus siliculosus TaxID=2880 RepID=D8LL13_ECTSI|nr:Endo-1,3-beta-glucanase, family GH81 [Ectocarpus siliculosus]|eukprot:CBN76107.1 Endo-1,3-beta-glucanase, family GH81 [Ectocarpus siliculosus]